MLILESIIYYFDFFSAQALFDDSPRVSFDVSPHLVVKKLKLASLFSIVIDCESGLEMCCIDSNKISPDQDCFLK